MPEDTMPDERDPWLDRLVAELPRERETSDLLEERTVRTLRAAGLLSGESHHRRLWIGGAVAASVALFASGLAMGQWLATRHTLALLGTRDAATYAESAASIQRAGVAYVQAVEQLVEKGTPRDSTQALIARETALAVLHDAANQVIRLAPNDPVAAKILQGFDRMEDSERARQQARVPARRVMWF